MKKLYLFILLNTFFLFSSAQPKVYTTPKIGDAISTEYAYTNVAKPGTMGADLTWDYSYLKDSAFASLIQIIDPAGTPFVADFPGTQYSASLGDTLFSYFKMQGNNPAILGLESSTSKFEYLHPLVTLQYPFTYNDLFISSDTISVVVPPISETSKQLDTILVSGYGTLKLPGHTFNDVLQTRHINTSAGTINIPGGGVINLPPTIDTSFDYYVNGQPSPLLTYSIYKGKIQLITYSKSTGLPLHFISFTAEAENGDIQLNWQTANESNTDFFTVERSVDGTHFNVIGKVTAKGEQANNYYYSDNNAPREAQVIYYRIQETDKDGKYIYTQIASCKVTDQPGITLYPNPANNYITVTGIKNYTALKIYNMAGQQLMNYLLKDNVITIPINKLSNGLYIVELSNNNKITKASFLKK